MPSYSYKDKPMLAYEANKKRLRTEGYIIIQDLLNEALNEMTIEFNAELDKGHILEIGGTREEMKHYLKVAAIKQLELTDGSSKNNSL